MTVLGIEDPGVWLAYVLSLAGGVGGTITLAAYGYWIREKGWTTPVHMRLMRIDNRSPTPSRACSCSRS